MLLLCNDDDSYLTTSAVDILKWLLVESSEVELIEFVAYEL